MDDRKRREVLRAFGATGVIGLAGCSSSNGNGNDNNGSGDNTKTSSGGNGGSSGGNGGSSDAIKWWNLWVQGTSKKAAAELQSGFEQKTGLTIKQTKYENTPYKSAITNALGTDNAPDVFYMWAGPNRLGRYVQNGNVVPVGDQFSSEMRKKFISSAIRGTKYEPGKILSWRSEQGKMYMTPLDLAAIVIWYNKSVLKDAGVDPSTLKHKTDMSWQDFLSVCEKVKQAGQTPIMIGNSNRWTIGHWIAAFMIKAVGVEAYLNTAYGQNDMSFTDKPFVTALSRLKELYTKGYMTQSLNSLNNNEAASLFFNGKAAFWHQGTWVTEQISSQAPKGFGGIPDDMDYMWWPVFPDIYKQGASERVGVVPNTAFAVSTQAKKRGDAHFKKVMKFIDYLSSVEGQQKYFKITGNPVTRPEVFDNVDLDATQKTLTSTVKPINDAKQVGPVFDVAFLPQATETLLSGGQSLFNGKSPKKVLQELEQSNKKALSNL